MTQNCQRELTTANALDADPILAASKHSTYIGQGLAEIVRVWSHPSWLRWGYGLTRKATGYERTVNTRKRWQTLRERSRNGIPKPILRCRAMGAIGLRMAKACWKSLLRFDPDPKVDSDVNGPLRRQMGRQHIPKPTKVGATGRCFYKVCLRMHDSGRC